jgi:hypothetical protein
MIEKYFGKRVTNIDLGASERTSGIATFSKEQRKGLARLGYEYFYPLTGQSIATLRDAGNSFWSTWHKGDAFENVPSMRSEVALLPRILFLKNSNNKTLSQQLSMISRFSTELAKVVPGVAAKMGGASDYSELAFAHERATGDKLFGSKFNYDYARTTTPSSGSDVAMVGNFGDRGLDVDYWGRDDGNDRVWAVPLVVPASAR